MRTKNITFLSEEKKSICIILGILLFSFLGKIVSSAKTNEDFYPFPKANHSYWRTEIPVEMRMDYIKNGEGQMDKLWDKIPDSLFFDYYVTGNRENFENASFERRYRLAKLVMAEIMEYKGRFIPAICEGLNYFAEQEFWWGVPAHYTEANLKEKSQIVDLFNAETASMLAWTLYMLDNEIGRYDKTLPRKISKEIERRMLVPCLTENQTWKQKKDNWLTWISANWLECVLICEYNKMKRTAAINQVKDLLVKFIDAYPDDGYCDEGVNYWDRSAASLFEAYYFLSKDNKDGFSLDKRRWKKMQRMGNYIGTMYIGGTEFVNFSDATASYIPNINILFPFGQHFKDSTMIYLAAYIGKKYDYLKYPTILFNQSICPGAFGRELMFLSMFDLFQKTNPRAIPRRNYYFDQSQVMVASTSKLYVAIKGGNNNENHNHNDIGNFIIYYEGKPVVIDLGKDTYSAQTFSSKRYELFNNRSSYHNVPLINGQEQPWGSNYKATEVKLLQNDTASIFRLNLSEAYPVEANVNLWKRTLWYDIKKNSITLREDYDLKEVNGSNQIILMCYGKPILIQDGIIGLADNKVKLTYQPSQMMVKWEQVNIKGGVLKQQWGNDVYRITLSLTEPHKKKNSIMYKFSSY